MELQWWTPRGRDAGHGWCGACCAPLAEAEEGGRLVCPDADCPTNLPEWDAGHEDVEAVTPAGLRHYLAALERVARPRAAGDGPEEQAR